MNTLELILFDLNLAWRNVRARAVPTLITIVVVAVALALFVTVNVLGDGVRRGVTRASDPFGVLVIGPKGDAQQLVLSTLLLNGDPLGTLPYTIYARLVDDPRSALTVPLAMADNVGGARILGTNEAFFALRPSVNAPSPFVLAEGRRFSAGFEAVLGATAAAGLGLAVGDQFVAAHGTGATLNADVHSDVYTVVGILQPTNTAFDGAVLTTLESVWALHADEEHADEEHADEEHADEEHADEAHAGEEHAGEEHADAAHAGDLTAILVKPVGFAEGNQIWQSFYSGSEVQAAFPGQQLGGLFDLLRQVEQILTNVGYLAAGMAGLTIFLAIYSATLAREQMIAVMRGIGASRAAILRMVLFEALLVALLGALLARLLGYGAAWLLAGAIGSANLIPIPLRFVPAIEPLLWLLPLLLGLLAGIIPALMAYRVDIVDKLFGS